MTDQPTVKDVLLTVRDKIDAGLWRPYCVPPMEDGDTNSEYDKGCGCTLQQIGRVAGLHSMFERTAEQVQKAIIDMHPDILIDPIAEIHIVEWNDATDEEDARAVIDRAIALCG